MHTQTGHSHRHEDLQHEFLHQRFMAQELDATEFTREIFGEPAETPVPTQSSLIRQVDEAEANWEVDGVEDE